MLASIYRSLIPLMALTLHRRWYWGHIPDAGVAHEAADSRDCQLPSWLLATFWVNFARVGQIQTGHVWQWTHISRTCSDPLSTCWLAKYISTWCLAFRISSVIVILAYHNPETALFLVTLRTPLTALSPREHRGGLKNQKNRVSTWNFR